MSNKKLIDAVKNVMDMLRQLPCGGIGEDGMTMDELESVAETGTYAGYDAMYDMGQRMFRTLESALDESKEREKIVLLDSPSGESLFYEKFLEEQKSYVVMIKTGEYSWDSCCGPYDTVDAAENALRDWFRKDDIPHMKVFQFFRNSSKDIKK